MQGSRREKVREECAHTDLLLPWLWWLHFFLLGKIRISDVEEREVEFGEP